MRSTAQGSAEWTSFPSLLVFLLFTSPPSLSALCSCFLLPPASLNLQCLDHCSIPTPLLCFCLWSLFSKSPALHSAGSKDTCGECVHRRVWVGFIKGKAAEWNCSFLNNLGDGATGRQKGDEGRGSRWRGKYWLSRFTSELLSQWLMDGLKGGFQKAEMFGGLN